MSDPDEENPRPRAPRPSQAPSWVMVGFIFGALFVFALPRHDPPPAAAEVSEPTPPPPAPERPNLSTIEAVFAEWGKYAVWDRDTTEVALWDAATRTYADCYEVLRSGDGLYFRSIPRLTRPILAHGVVDASPLLFTEPTALHEAWLADKAAADWRNLADAARGSVGSQPEAARP